MQTYLEDIEIEELVKCVRDGEILNQVLKKDTDISLEILERWEMEYQSNRGNICKSDGCNNRARIKGLCTNCYQNNRKKLRIE